MPCGKRKIQIKDWDGAKLDSAVVSSTKEADKVFKRWKKKGLF